MFLNGKPLPHPFHRRLTFFSKDLFILSLSGVIYITPLPLSMLAIELSPRNFAFGLTPPPLKSIFGLNTRSIFFSFFFNYSFLYLYFNNRLQPPHPPRTYSLPLPCVSLPSYFMIISFSNLNVQYVFFFFIRAIQISPRIKVYNMNLYAESAESQLLIKIQGLNNCIFGKLINIFSVFFSNRP